MAENRKSGWPISRQIIVVALAFGTATLLVMAAGLLIPVYGELIHIDPREIFVTLGSALTGPLGGMIIGLMAHSWFAGRDFQVVSLLIHVLGGLWAGVAYKKWVFERLKMPWQLLGWLGVVFAYYFVILFFGFVSGVYILFPELFAELFGTRSPWQAYAGLAQAAAPEFVITAVTTTVIFIILPPKYRRPLW
jgi:uncharacterized membrane protein